MSQKALHYQELGHYVRSDNQDCSQRNRMVKPVECNQTVRKDKKDGAEKKQEKTDPPYCFL